jgi:hypothetical protein
MKRITGVPAAFFVTLFIGQTGCNDGGAPLAPIAPSVIAPSPIVTPAPQARFPDGATFRDVTLSGVVFEQTPNGRAPIAQVEVYCEPCGVETHTFATTDSDGSYRFTGVWTDGFPTRISITKAGYADPPGLPKPTPPNPSGAGWREVAVNGDTRFDVELIRR